MMRSLLSSSLLAIALVACGPNNGRHYTDSAGGGGGGGGGGGDADNTTGCSDSAKLVYVVDSNNTFSQFDPATKTFHDLGTLSCPAQFLATPFSMGVDRNTIAWVLYSSGELFRVDILTNLACTKTNWSSPSGLMQFGMGFSTDMAGGTTDTLFVAGGSGPTQPTSTLAKLSTASMAASTVGTVQGWPELTGTGSAELWGFFPDASNPRIEKINKTSGAATTTYNESTIAGMPSAWAFAFWGGDFWVFLMRSTETSTTVYHVNGMTGAIVGTTPTNTRTIVGAGVSTCAPVVIQ
jgi:hypothetical protein